MSAYTKALHWLSVCELEWRDENSLEFEIACLGHELAELRAKLSDYPDDPSLLDRRKLAAAHRWELRKALGGRL